MQHVGRARGPPCIQPAKGAALDIPREPLAGCQYFLARSARPGPLCGTQRVQNSRNEPHSGPMAAADMLAEILRLPAEERARLALELIRSLDTEAEAGAADAWDVEIARRGAEVDAGVAETMTADEYRAHVRQRRDARARR